MNESYKQYLSQKRAENCAEQASTAYISRILMGIVVVGFLSTKFQYSQLLVWFVFFILVSTATFMVHTNWGPSSSDFNHRRWFYCYLVLNFLMGFISGLVSFFFFLEGDIVYLGFIVSVFVGYLAASLIINFSYQVCFLSSCFGMAVPFLAKMFLIGVQPYPTLGFMAFFYILILNNISKYMERLFKQSALNQFNNSELVEELKKEKRITEKASQEKNRFLAAASHDLRQPLHSANLLLSALESEVNTSRQKKLLDGVSNSFNALKLSFNSLLDMSKLEAGVVKANPVQTNINEIILQLVSEYSKQAKDKNIDIFYEKVDMAVYTDPELLNRILSNLISNAINYTDKGYVKLSVARFDSEGFRISVIDTGKGIPPDEVGKIYSEYYQVSNPERDRNKGFGLGLSIVKKLCELLNIKISVESVIGSGTEFQLVLPKDSLSVGIDSQLPKSEYEVSEFNNEILMNKLIVVIDDNEEVLESMKYFFEPLGCSCGFATSVEDAINWLSSVNKEPDIIVSDYRLRDNVTGVDGWKTICIEFNLDIPLIIVTGDTSPNELKQLSSGGFTVLNKPASAQELKSAICKLI